MSSNEKKKTQARFEDGFSLVEAVIAILVLTIGLMGTAAAITYALEYGSISRNVTTGKTMVLSAIEEVETLRNARRLDFKQIANVGAVNNAGAARNFDGFSTGFQPISRDPGEDGVNGTDDDLIAVGADGDWGTADDFSDPTLIRSGYQRQIEITNMSDSLKRVEVRIRYPGSGGTIGEIGGVCYLNDEARITR